jgi:hypothetical protein
VNGQARIVARLDRRHGFERRGERERLALLDDHVADVRRVDGLHATLAQRFVDRAGDEPVRDIVQDLIAEPLPDDLGGHLARPKPGNARGLAVVARDLVDLGVDDRARDLDEKVLLGIGDVE